MKIHKILAITAIMAVSFSCTPENPDNSPGTGGTTDPTDTTVTPTEPIDTTVTPTDPTEPVDTTTTPTDPTDTTVTPTDPTDPAEPIDTTSKPGVPTEGNELACPNPPAEGTVALDELVGYGAQTSGGNGAVAAEIHHFDNGQALQTWLLARKKVKSTTPAIAWLSGTFDSDDGRDFNSAHPWFDVKETSNISFIGVDGFVMDRIGFFLSNASNIIIRNIYFKQPKADNGADAVSMQDCSNVWVDHCTFESMNQEHDYEDGSCDITHASHDVTVSWCRFIKTQKSCLVGHSSSATADVAIKATFHHNWFDNSSSRHPRVRYGTVHVYNNLYDGSTTYGVGSAMGAMVLVEYNVFNGVALPTDIATFPAKKSGSTWVSNLTDKTAGYLYACRNLYLDRPDNSNVAVSPYPFTNVQYTTYGGTAGTPLTYADFKPEYEYKVTPTADLAALVRGGAGAGRLGYSNAPTDVDNGNVTVDPGTGGDNPGGSDPGTGGDNPGGSDPGTGGDNPGGDSPVGGDGTYTHNFTTDGFASDSFFTISGNQKTGLNIVIGGVTYTQGLKMESAAGEVSFNATNAGTLTIYVTTATGAVKIDGTKTAATDNIITAKLAAGKHVINKSDSIQLLLVRYIEE